MTKELSEAVGYSSSLQLRHLGEVLNAYNLAAIFDLTQCSFNR